jgi:hypothetical protein
VEGDDVGPAAHILENLNLPLDLASFYWFEDLRRRIV